MRWLESVRQGAQTLDPKILLVIALKTEVPVSGSELVGPIFLVKPSVCTPDSLS